MMTKSSSSFFVILDIILPLIKSAMSHEGKEIEGNMYSDLRHDSFKEIRINMNDIFKRKKTLRGHPTQHLKSSIKVIQRAEKEKSREGEEQRRRSEEQRRR